MRRSESITGIDVSKWQRSVPWDLVQRDHRFCYVKATEGVGYVDPLCAIHVDGSYASGLDVGLYHFATPKRLSGSTIEDDARAEAEHFATLINRYIEICDLPPVLDIEWGGSTGVRATQIQHWIGAFLTQLALKSLRSCAVYTGRNFWRWKMGKSLAFADHPLWLASYSSRPKQIPGWPASIWQYTNKLQIGNMRCDGNRFMGSEDEYKAFLRWAKPPAPLPPDLPRPIVRALEILHTARGFKRAT